MCCGDDEDPVVSGEIVDPDDLSGPNIVQGKITTDLTLTADREHLLRGAVFVEDGATLTIEPGTTVFGEGATLGTLIVARGGKLNARGTAGAPIVFTSDAQPGSRRRGLWGGLIVNGRAPINQGTEAFGEGDTGAFGGNDPNDSSGVYQYIRVEFAGIEFSPDHELNGIAFQGVGAGTVVDHVQVHFNQDDGSRCSVEPLTSNTRWLQAPAMTLSTGLAKDSSGLPSTAVTTQTTVSKTTIAARTTRHNRGPSPPYQCDTRRRSPRSRKRHGHVNSRRCSGNVPQFHRARF